MPRRPTLRFPVLKNPQQAQRASLYALALILGGLITIGLFNLAKLIGPKTIDAPTIPFGLPTGTPIAIGVDAGLNLDGLSPEILQELTRASDLLKAGKWQSAADIYNTLAIRDPNLPAALVGKARAWLISDSLDANTSANLQSLLEQLERKLPESGEVLYLRGALAERQGQSTVALEFLEQALRKAPGLPETHYLLGKVLLQGGQPLGAQTEARTGISLTEGADGRFYALLAQAYHDEGRIDSCGQVVEYALTRFPSSAELTVLDGILQEYRGSFEIAERNYRRVLALEPRNFQAAKALQSLGEKSPPGMQGGKGMITPREKADLAIRILEPLVTEYPENMPLRDALGQAYLKSRQFDLAHLQFKTIEENDPEYPNLQQRIQEANAVDRDRTKELVMTEELKRGVDSIRVAKQAGRSSSERLGHYLVRWGASPKEFFARYPESTFQKIADGVWQEHSTEAPLHITTTISFQPDRGLTAIHVTARDTAYKPGQRGIVYDLYGRLLGQNSRISGIGVSTGDTQCDSLGFQGAVWETTDNFELMAQFVNDKSEVRLLRLDRGQFETMPRLCGHMSRLLKY